MAKKFNELVALLPREDQDEIKRKTEALSATIKLEKIRKARKISQETLASAMRVSQPAISKMENEANMTVRTLSAFAAGLGGKVRIEIEFPDGVSYKVL